MNSVQPIVIKLNVNRKVVRILTRNCTVTPSRVPGMYLILQRQRLPVPCTRKLLSPFDTANSTLGKKNETNFLVQ